MSITHSDTIVSSLKINKFSTIADFASAQSQGLIGQDEISFINESAISGTDDGTNWTSITINGTTKAIPSGGGGGGGSSTLAGLIDTSIVSPTDGQALIFDSGSSVWKNIAIPAGVTSLASLSDTSISSPANGQILKYNGTAWVNINETEQVNADWNASSGPAQILNKPTIPTVNNATLTIQRNGTTVKTFTANASSDVTANISVPTQLNNLSDVTVSSPTNGQIFAFDSASNVWTNVAAPTVNNATLTIQKNGTDVATFTANASSNVTANISVPSAPGTLNTTATASQATSSSEALSGNITLHKVAKTGTYSDLIGTPTIPTVNNATLTIQKNGTDVATFTANASSNATANISIRELPAVTSTDNNKVLMVVNGAWAAQTVDIQAYYTGSNTPPNSMGNNGDIYLQVN